MNGRTVDFAAWADILTWTLHRNTGSGFYHVLWISALLYCLFFVRQPRLRVMGRAALLLLLCLPPLVWFCHTYGFSRNYYPRFAWILLVELLLAAVGADLARRQQGGWRKGVTLLAVIVAIGICGQPLFTKKFYHCSTPYKVQHETIAIADYLTQTHLGTRAYITHHVNIEIRQYDARILLVLGKGMAWNLELALTHDQWRDKVPQLMSRWKPFEIIVLTHVANHEEKLNQLGWRVEKRIGRYDVYSRASGS